LFSFIKYYGHSPILSPFSFNLNVLTLPLLSTLDNTLSNSFSSNASSILLANFVSLSSASNILSFPVISPVNQSSDICLSSLSSIAKLCLFYYLFLITIIIFFFFFYLISFFYFFFY